MRFIVLCLIGAALTCLPGTPLWAIGELEEDSVIGDWVLPENGSVVRVYRCADALCVKVVKVADPRRRDVNNPNPALRNRPLVGIVLSDSFRKREPAKWRGKLYSTLDGVTYEGTLNMLNKDSLTMVGCVFTDLLCEAKTFYRAKTQLPEDSQAAQLNGAASRDLPDVIPAIPERAPDSLQLDLLRANFNAFLDSRPKNIAGPHTEKERDKLFEDFLKWSQRQPSNSPG